jgi:Ca2+-binding RTX toxin-like protein
MTGTTGADFFRLSQGGEDTVNGGTGDDGFYMGAAFSSGDKLTGGGGFDQLGLQGNYGTAGTPLVLGAASFTDMDMLVFISGGDARFGDTAGNLYDYYITTDDANVGAGQKLIVSWNNLQAGEDVTFDGSAETDGKFLTYAGAGVDTITGGDQNDGFYFGYGMWGASDSVVGGAGTDDLGLQGNYTAAGSGAITFTATQLAGIEMIVLLTGDDTRFGAPVGQGYAYDLTMDDGNVASGQMMYISANTLLAAGGTIPADETLKFDGSAELDGSFTVYGGHAADTIIGGAGNDAIWGGEGADSLTGGFGNDSFHYISTAGSTATAMDQIVDFTTGDTIDLSVIDAITGGSDNAFSFVGDTAFSNTAGELRAFEQALGQWQVEGDVDGDGTADLVISVIVTDSHSFAAGDFVL